MRRFLVLSLIAAAAGGTLAGTAQAGPVLQRGPMVVSVLGKRPVPPNPCLTCGSSFRVTRPGGEVMLNPQPLPPEPPPNLLRR